MTSRDGNQSPLQPGSGPRPIRLILVEDHTLVRESLKALLSNQRGLDLVGDTGNGKRALALMRARHPDVVILDLKLSDGNGIALCRSIRRNHPLTQVLFLSAFGDEITVASAAAAGAAGFLPKSADLDELVRAIQAVAEGRPYFRNPVTGALLQAWPPRPAAEPPPDVDRLTPQELRVLRLLTEGLTNKEIAARLALSHKTIKNYLSRIYHKLNVTRRSAAVTAYLLMKKTSPLPAWHH